MAKGKTPFDRHGTTILPDSGPDWTDYDAPSGAGPAPTVRGRKRSYGTCGDCWLAKTRTGDCECSLF